MKDKQILALELDSERLKNIILTAGLTPKENDSKDIYSSTNIILEKFEQSRAEMIAEMDSYIQYVNGLTAKKESLK